MRGVSQIIAVQELEVQPVLDFSHSAAGCCLAGLMALLVGADAPQHAEPWPHSCQDIPFVVHVWPCLVHDMHFR
jgi:hypothetical protein